MGYRTVCAVGTSSSASGSSWPKFVRGGRASHADLRGRLGNDHQGGLAGGIASMVVVGIWA